MKNIFFLFLISIFFTSCKKDNTAQQENYMTASVNNVETDFNLSIFADTLSNPVSTIISGTQASTTSHFTLNFVSYTGDQLVPGTYTGLNTYNLYCIYRKSSLDKDYTNIAFTNFTVGIENINDAYVEGNFHGILKDAFNPDDSIVISNGRFKVPFVH